MSGNNKSLSKLNKKELYEIVCNLKNENNELKEKLDNLQSIFKITGEGEFSPAIYEKEYQELLQKKFEFQDKYNDLQKKFTPDKDAMMIANKKIDKLEKELYELKDIEDEYENTKNKLNKLTSHHERQSKSYGEIVNKNVELEKRLEELENSIDTSHLEHLEKKIKKLVDANKTLISDNEKLLTEVKELRGTAGGSKGRLTSYKNKILEIYECDIEADYEWKDIFKMIRDTKVINNEKLKEENEELKKDLLKSHHKNASLKGKLHNLENTDTKVLEDTISEKNVEIQELHTKIKFIRSFILNTTN